MTVIGIDISKYNYGWTPDKATKPIEFVIQRSSWASYKDEKFDLLLPEVQKIPVRGVYHYYSSGVSWQYQANLMMDIVKDKGFHFYVVDYEGAYNVLNRRTTAEIYEFVKYVKAQTGKKCLVYFNQNIYNLYIKAYGYENWANQQDIWFAQYPLTLTQTPPYSAPKLPTGLDTWKFWQYGGGDVNFTAGRHAGADYGGGLQGMDLNYWNGTKDEMYSYFDVTTAPPVPVEPPVVIPPVGKSATVVVTPAVNVRSGAGTQYPIAATSVPTGIKVSILEESKDSFGNTWGKITQGWVAMIYNTVVFIKYDAVIPPPVIIIPDPIPEPIPTSTQKEFLGEFAWALPRWPGRAGPAIIAGSFIPKSVHPNLLLGSNFWSWIKSLSDNREDVWKLFIDPVVGPTKGINSSNKVIYIPAVWSGNMVKVLAREMDKTGATWIKVDNISISNPLPSVTEVNHLKTPHLVSRMSTVNSKNQFITYPKTKDGLESPWDSLNDPLLSLTGSLWLPADWFTNKATVTTPMFVRDIPNSSGSVGRSLLSGTVVSIKGISVDSYNNIWGKIGDKEWISLKFGNACFTTWFLV